jgi:dTMP kinase
MESDWTRNLYTGVGRDAARSAAAAFDHMARDMVRGLDADWVKSLYSIAIKPDVVFYLKLPPEKLIQRNFMKNHTLDYWESGMDLGLSLDMFDSFVQYQQLLADKFDEFRRR